MKISALNNMDTHDLNKLLLKDGKLIPVPYKELTKFSQEKISVFCHKHAFYQIPTTELIDFLRNEIGELKAIEIGAGNGSIGRSLGIPLTDNRVQERPKVKLYYDTMGQPTVTYPSDIIKLGGNVAVERMKPDVVIASWVTGKDIGNHYGIQETKIVRAVKKYIHIGNELTHAAKLILTRFDYKIIQEDWLVSRSMEKHKNVIYLINNT